jgi:xyloglucan-specific exo-beta-1,4-glucanase
MKNALLKRIFGGLAVLAAIGLLAQSAPAGDYVWRNAKIGGGGYMPNIVFSPAERGLAYLRSDMGGAYRWDEAAKAWIPLQDADADWNARGVESIAPDPKNPDIVYAAVGMTHKLPAGILISHDRGGHWQRVAVPFRMSANDLGRDIGERLAVDPNNGAILYFASRYDGLQRSGDGGKSWSKAASFPHPGLGAPTDWRGTAGLSFAIFDPASAKDGISQTIYVGSGDPNLPHLYRSLDGGAHWQAVAGTPDLTPIRGALSAKGKLVITFADGMGPYMVSKGGVYVLDTKTGAWSDITPDPAHPAFAGLSLDAQAPDTLAVAPLYRPLGDTVWHSTDFGAHWTSLKEISKRDVSETPFLKFGHAEAEFGWWMTGLAIDPFDPSHLAYTTGATVYATDDLGKPAMLWKPWTEGIEQTAVIALSSPAAGPPLVSGIGDIGGYTHVDLAVSPEQQADPVFTNSDTVDYAGRAPNVMVRSGTHHAHPRPGEKTASLAYSLDFGKSWQPLFAPLPAGYALPDPIGYNYGDAYIDSPIAVSADGKSFVVSTPDAPSVTRDRGRNWSKVAGLPQGTTIIADRADGKVFYAVDYAGRRIFVSRDGGLRFKPVPTAGMPKDIAGDAPAARRDMPPREVQPPFLATPGKRGDLWFVSQHVLYHSQDGGKTFAKVESDLAVAMLSFGKAPPGKTYPALFAIGDKGNLRAIWRSDDAGKSWLRVNDGVHEYFRAFRCIAGDLRVFGRVYVGTDGRGIVYGEPKP